MKRTFVILAILIALGGGIFALTSRRDKKGPQFETTRVERGNLVAKVTATGTLSALVTVLVGSQVSGRIDSLNADWNSVVKKGQVIARIDPQLYKAAVEQAKANLLQAQGSLASAEAKAEDSRRIALRSEDLWKQKLLAEADRDTAVATAKANDAMVISSQGNLAQAKAQLHQAEINLDYTTIYSPVSGVVISRSIDIGQTVAASFQSPTLFTIAEDLRKMQVDTSVAEADVGKLAPGMDVTFTVDAYPGVKWKGKVRQIRNAAVTTQNVVTYDSVIDVENPELKLRPGMTANVTFVYSEKDDVLKVANAALRFRMPPELNPNKKQDSDTPDGGVREHNGQHERGGGRAGKGDGPSDSRVVWILGADGTPQRKRVKVGLNDGVATEIISDDIKEGMQLITESTATPGASSSTPGGGARPPRLF